MPNHVHLIALPQKEESLALGAGSFVDHLEQTLQRTIRPRKPGPKGGHR